MFSRHEGTPVKMVDFREEREKRAFTRMEVSERERERERKNVIEPFITMFTLFTSH